MTRAHIMCVHLTYVYIIITQYNVLTIIILLAVFLQHISSDVIDVVIINITMSRIMHALLCNINTKLVKAL